MRRVKYEPHEGMECRGERYGLPCDHFGHQIGGLLFRAGITPEQVPTLSDRELMDVRWIGPKSVAALRKGQR